MNRFDCKNLKRKKSSTEIVKTKVKDKWKTGNKYLY